MFVPFLTVQQGNDPSPQDCLSKKKLAHIKWIIYELPLDRQASIDVYQEIKYLLRKISDEESFFFLKHYYKNMEYHRNINNSILSGFSKPLVRLEF